MSHLELTEREIERVLAGHQPPGRPDLAEVAFLIARLRTMGDFEQAPPMSPRLLAELDAAEVELRDQPAPPRTRVQRTHPSRRRWRLVGAAALVLVVGGLIAIGAQGAGDRQRTEIDAPRTDATEAATPTTTTVPETTTTTAAPTTTTTAPPTTEPETTTTEAPAPPAEPTGPPPEAMPLPWPSEGEMNEQAMEELENYCEHNPRVDWCEWWWEEGPGSDRPHDHGYDTQSDGR
jgi:hypothetical protein